MCISKLVLPIGPQVKFIEVFSHGAPKDSVMNTLKQTFSPVKQKWETQITVKNGETIILMFLPMIIMRQNFYVVPRQMRSSSL